jgi:hypothetical protein
VLLSVLLSEKGKEREEKRERERERGETEKRIENKEGDRNRETEVHGLKWRQNFLTKCNMFIFSSAGFHRMVWCQRRNGSKPVRFIL